MAAPNESYATGADRQTDELRRRAAAPAQNGSVLPIEIDEKKKAQVRTNGHFDETDRQG